MTVFMTGLPDPVGAELYTFTQTDGSPANVTAQSVVTAARRISAVQIDNTTNSTASYLKIWEADPALGLGVGSVRPEITLKAPASTKIQYTFSPGMNMTQTWVGVTSYPGITATSFPTGTITAQLLMEIP